MINHPCSGLLFLNKTTRNKLPCSGRRNSNVQEFGRFGFFCTLFLISGCQSRGASCFSRFFFFLSFQFNSIPWSWIMNPFNRSYLYCGPTFRSSSDQNCVFGLVDRQCVIYLSNPWKAASANAKGQKCHLNPENSKIKYTPLKSPQHPCSGGSSSYGPHLYL